MEALEKQKDFTNGVHAKKAASKNLQRKLDKIAKEAIDLQTVGDGAVAKRTCLIYDVTKSNRLTDAAELEKKLDAYRDAHDDYWKHEEYKAMQQAYDDIKLREFSGARDEYVEAVKAGSDMGALLGKKLQLHNESRERVDTRLRSGKIDAKRLAHAGYGIEGIFKQIHVDKYKKANLHITLDGSGCIS